MIEIQPVQHTNDLSHDALMRGMTVHHLRFTVRASEAVVFDNQPGSALRGALYESLSENFCTDPRNTNAPDHAHYCPTCWLMATEDSHSSRGQDIPRPITVEPVQADHIVHAGETFRFGFSLIGRARDLLPYVVRAAEKMGRIGIGRGRGRFTLIDIAEYSPLFDVERVMLDGRIVKHPTLGVTPAQVQDAVSIALSDRILMEFITPLALKSKETIIGKFDTQVFTARLIERCQSLAEHYAEGAVHDRTTWRQLHERLSVAAATTHIGYDDTRWTSAFSGSRRKSTMTAISGLVGRVRLEGDLTALLPWLLWGQSFHVGKNAVKGNGWYRIIR